MNMIARAGKQSVSTLYNGVERTKGRVRRGPGCALTQRDGYETRMNTKKKTISTPKILSMSHLLLEMLE